VGGVGPKHLLEAARAEHEHPIEALRPDRTDHPLGERVRSRSPDRGLEDVHLFGPEELIDGAGILGVAVSDHEPDPSKLLSHCEVASLLGHPRRVGVLGDAEDVPASSRS
jgi:hypothetical protein